MRALFAILAALLFAFSAAAQIAAEGAREGAREVATKVAEPPGLWTGPMQGETPATLAGAGIVDAETVARLRESGALLLDVAGVPRKPEKLPQTTRWLPTHLSIPGAVWLADAGLGNPNPEFQRRFGDRVGALTGGDKEKPMVVFCHPKCWGSWNAGKRLIMLGYSRVYWYPDGAEGWQDKFAAAPTEEDAAWKEMNR